MPKSVFAAIDRAVALWGKVPPEHKTSTTNFIKAVRTAATGDPIQAIRFSYGAALFQYTEYREGRFRLPKRHAELAMCVSMFHILLKWGRAKNFANLGGKDFDHLDRVPPKGMGAQYRKELLELNENDFARLHWMLAKMSKSKYESMSTELSKNKI
jgi:hypothetical protein